MRYIDDYAAGKRDPASVTYADERLRPITEGTYGCCIYQEQLMEISKQIGGFTPAEADDLRKAIGKKKRDLMATMKDKFLEGSAASGTQRSVADDLWSLMTAAADYSFNRSHAACYALIAYRTAYLKANYPAEYMAAVISSVMSTKDKVPFFVNRCNEMGIEVLPPDVNASDHGFVVSGSSIRFGLDAVKNVGHQAVEAIIGARERGGPVRVDLGLLRPGGRAGRQQAGDRVPGQVRRPRTRPAPRRRGMLEVLPQAQASGQKAQDDALRGQGSIFDLGGGDAGRGLARRGVQRRSGRRSRARSSASASSSRSRRRRSGPSSRRIRLTEVREALRERVDCTLADVAGKQDGAWLTVGGIVAEAKKVRTRSGGYVMFAKLDDLEGQVELFVRDAAGEQAEAIELDRVVVVRGRVDQKGRDQMSLVVQEASPFEPDADELALARERARKRMAPGEHRPAGSTPAGSAPSSSRS